MNMKICDEISERVLSFLPKDMKIFLVGGFLRDKLLQKESFDRDYVLIGQNIVQEVQKLAEELGGYFVMLDEQREISRIVLSDKINYLDFAKCNGETIFDDIQKRDFSINSLAYDLRLNELIDTQSSCKDISEGLIKAVSEENIKDDPLRILRAYRFCSQLDFVIEEKTLEFIIKYQHLLNQVSKERINTEFMKLLEGKNSAKVLQMMKESSVLFEIFPEMKAQIDVPPNLHHHLCLIDHSIETVRQIEENFDSQPDSIKKFFESPFGSATRYAYLKLAALLHDLGKPATWTIDPDSKRHRFIKHDEIGAQMAKPLLRRLKFSNSQISYVQKLIKNHIYPSQLIKTDTSQKAINRMYRKLEDETFDIILLARADRLSARGVEITPQIVQENIAGLENLLSGYILFKESQKPLEKLLSGDELMQMFGLTPSPRLGQLLNSLKEAQIDGDISTKEEAVEFIKKLL